MFELLTCGAEDMLFPFLVGGEGGRGGDNMSAIGELIGRILQGHRETQTKQ